MAFGIGVYEDLLSPTSVVAWRAKMEELPVLLQISFALNYWGMKSMHVQLDGKQYMNVGALKFPAKLVG